MFMQSSQSTPEAGCKRAGEVSGDLREYFSEAGSADSLTLEVDIPNFTIVICAIIKQMCAVRTSNNKLRAQK